MRFAQLPIHTFLKLLALMSAAQPNGEFCSKSELRISTLQDLLRISL